MKRRSVKRRIKKYHTIAMFMEGFSSPTITLIYLDSPGKLKLKKYIIIITIIVLVNIIRLYTLSSSSFSYMFYSTSPYTPSSHATCGTSPLIIQTEEILAIKLQRRRQSDEQRHEA